jgi:hypothetical protein
MAPPAATAPRASKERRSSVDIDANLLGDAAVDEELAAPI